MGIQIIDGFRVISSENGYTLAIESDRIEECMKYAVDNGISRVFMHSYDGYKLDNVNFLKEYDFITEISITDDQIEISGVHYLANLKYLSLSNGKQPVDLSKFKHLKEASIDWNNKVIGLDSLNHIKRLSIRKFKPQSKDFTVLARCNDVEYLHITESNIESFKGIENLQLLNHFEGHYLTKLESLEGLEKLSTHLKIIVLDYCRKLANYESVFAKLKHLKKLILGDCGPMESLKFIKAMKELKFLSFVNTNVVDGNISPVLNLEYVVFDNKRHYTHKKEDVKR